MGAFKANLVESDIPQRSVVKIPMIIGAFVKIEHLLV
jgi:hypothetical protein